MRFTYTLYEPSMAPELDGFLDEAAAYYTGCEDDGIEEYVQYWCAQPEIHWSTDFWCYRIAEENQTIGVLAVFRLPCRESDRVRDEMHLAIGEFWIDPAKRGKGLGTAILCEVLENSAVLFGRPYHTVQAVVFPDNVPSRRAFEKAGFLLDHVHPDGDALYYERISSESMHIAPLGTWMPYKFVVIFAREGAHWLYVRQRGRADYETPGGHIEPGESPMDAARRELYEETGVTHAQLEPLFDYALDGAFGSAAGQVFYAAVAERGVLPESEIEEVITHDTYPESLHYPHILPKLYANLRICAGENPSDEKKFPKI